MILIDHESGVFLGDHGSADGKIPFKPASSISFPAKYPSGRLKVLPALGYSNGCFSFLFLASSSICDRITSGSPGDQLECRADCEKSQALQTARSISQLQLLVFINFTFPSWSITSAHRSTFFISDP